jgi:flagellar biosynthesis protein FlhB
VSDEGTLPATQHRRERALREGQAPVTPEVYPVVIMLAVALLAGEVPAWSWHAFLKATTRLWTPEAFRTLAGNTEPFGSWRMFRETLPLLGALMALPVLILAAGWAQRQFRFFPSRVAPDLTRIAPRLPLESTQAKTALASLCIRLTFAIYLAFRVRQLIRSGGLLSDLPALTTRLAREGAAVWAVVAAGDYLWRRHRFEKSLMMTPQQVREESRSLEGDPRVKAHIKSRMEARYRTGAKRKGAGVSQRVVLLSGSGAMLVELYADATATPVILGAASGRSADQLRERAGRLNYPAFPVRTLPPATTCGIGSPIPTQLFDEMATIHGQFFGAPRARAGG